MRENVRHCFECMYTKREPRHTLALFHVRTWCTTVQSMYTTDSSSSWTTFFCRQRRIVSEVSAKSSIVFWLLRGRDADNH